MEKHFLFVFSETGQTPNDKSRKMIVSEFLKKNPKVVITDTVWGWESEFKDMSYSFKTTTHASWDILWLPKNDNTRGFLLTSQQKKMLLDVLTEGTTSVLEAIKFIFKNNETVAS